MNDWKLVGIKLGLHKARLDAIEIERHHKSDKCCYEMLGLWLEFDTSATMKKLKEVVQSLSDPMVFPSDSILNFKEYLQQRYADMHVKNVANIAYICHQCDMVTIESVTAIAKAMYYGNITINGDQCNNRYNDYYTRCNKSTNILEVLNDLNSASNREPFLLLIEGVQGIGKTVVCQEIALQWAKKQGLDGQFTFLISLHRVSLENINSLETLLEYLCCEKTTCQNISKILHNSRGDKVMVIIDGYEKLFDQQKNSADSFINKIIRREVPVFQRCDLVISSCHTASTKLYKFSNCTRIELLGFTKETKKQCIKFALGPNETSSTEFDELMAYLKKRSSLNSLCYYPLCLKELISLFREQKSHKKKLPDYETEIISIIANRIVLHLSESQEKNFLPLTSEIDKMSAEHQLILHKIGKLALHTLLAKYCNEDYKKDFTEECVYKLEDIKSGIDVADVKICFSKGLGFLKIIKSFENTDINQMLFTFLHVSVQEFLSALYISRLPPHKFRDIWKKTFWKAKFVNVWAYYLGITKDLKTLKNNLFGSWSSWLVNQNFSDEILNNKMKCLYLVHCLMEFPNNEIYRNAKRKVISDGGILDLSYAELDFDIVIIFLSRCKALQWIHLDLSNCCINDNKLAYFLKQLQPFLASLPSIKYWNLSNNQLSKDSLHNVFEVVENFNIADISLSHNEIKDEDLCESVVSVTHKSDDTFKNNAIHNYKSSFLLKSQDLLLNFKLVSSITSLYIIRCLLDNEVTVGLLKALNSCEALSLVLFYDNKLIHSCLVMILEELKALEQLKSVLIFDDSIKSDINIDGLAFKELLLSTNKLLAHNIPDHQILMALKYNPFITRLQLNDCHIIDEVMSNIAVILNNSQQWSLLDLSSNKIDDPILKRLCNALNDDCIVDVLKLARNRLTSLPLIVKLIQCLQPNEIDICGNSFTTDNCKNAKINMFMAVKLFACENPLCLTLACDNGNILICHKLDSTAVLTTKLTFKNAFTQVFVNDSTISSELLKRSLESNDLLLFLHLGNIKWIGEPLYKYTSFFEQNIFFSICENTVPDETLSILLSRFDINVNVSMIVSTDDLFISHRCNDGLLKWHITQKLLPLPTNKCLSYIRGCLTEIKHQSYSTTTDFVSKHNLMTEIMLYNDGFSQNNVHKIVTRLQKPKMPKYIFIYELQKQLDGTMITKWLFKEKVVIGNQATSEQVGWCLNLVLPLATVLRFISCHFSDEHYDTLIHILTSNHDTMLEEFSLYECNTKYIRTKQLAEALETKSTLTSLLVSCNTVTPLEADSIATALSIVINNNPSLVKVSFKFDNLPSSACGKIFQALSSNQKLKHFRFCNGQVSTKEAVHYLNKVLNNNPSLQIVNLKNNKMRSSGIKTIAEAFNNIHCLKLIALNGNQIDEKAADDIASIVASNVEIEKLLLYNNALNSEGISAICQAMMHHRNVQVLRISKNFIQEEAADDIAKVIYQNCLLKIVDVGKNRLHSNGIIKIVKSLDNMTSLQTLSLNDNFITCTEEVASSIAKIINKNKHLKVLHLDNNNFSIPDASPIAKALNKCTGLNELTLNNTAWVYSKSYNNNDN